MYVIRPLKLSDEEAFINFALIANLGITSLPKDRDLLHKKVLLSEESFSKDIQTPKQELYLFILEDVDNHIPGGICGIYSKTGVDHPTYFYKISTEAAHKVPGTAMKTQDQRYLKLVKYTNTSSEGCSLFLHPSFRKEGLGRLLSLSRFLFIAGQQQRFSDNYIACFRGVIDEDDNPPFWEGMGRHFLDVGYQTLEDLIQHDKSIIRTLLPRHPIYISLLNKKAQESIGQVHDNTMPALKILTNEGFTFTGEIDPFDAGPKWSCPIKEIRSVKQSIVAKVGKIDVVKNGTHDLLISNNRLDFRATYGSLQIDEHGDSIINAETARALQLDVGDEIRYTLINPVH